MSVLFAVEVMVGTYPDGNNAVAPEIPPKAAVNPPDADCLIINVKPIDVFGVVGMFITFILVIVADNVCLKI
jgi:hypothetical protein